MECPKEKSQFRHIAHVVCLCDQIAVKFPRASKHVVIICSYQTNSKMSPLAIDFIPNWTSVVIPTVEIEPSTFSVCSSLDQSISISSLKRLLNMSSWVDAIDERTVDIFGAIDFTIGGLGFASMLNVSSPSQLGEISNAIHWILKDSTLKDILDLKVSFSWF